MAYIGIPPKINFSSGLLDRFTGTTGTTVTLTNDISSENDIIVFVNFVKQDSTTYSVGGTGNKTLTLGGTLVSSDIVEVHYVNEVGQTVAPSANSVGSSQITADSITGQTAETSIATDDTILIHDTSAGALRKMTRANFVSGVGGDMTPAFFVSKASSSQTLSDSVATKVTFDSELYDTDSAFASDKFTVPSGEAGKYFFSTGINTYDPQASIKRHIVYFYKNGSQATMANNDFASNDNAQMFNFHSVVFNLSVGDYIEVYSLNDTADGGDSVVTASSSKFETWFSGYKLIGV